MISRLWNARWHLFIGLPLVVLTVGLIDAAAESVQAKAVLVLAMHGAPPEDFPEAEMEELFSLHGKIERADESERPVLEERYAILNRKMKLWPRTAKNDPYFEGSQTLAEELEAVSGNEVVVSFNEYCFPSVEEGLDSAVAIGATEIWVVTPMMTPGGGHSESDIPSAIKAAQGSHPKIPMHYAWPFDLTDIATFLSGQVNRHRRDAGSAQQGSR